MAERGLTVCAWGGIWGSALREAVSGPFTERTGIPVRHAPHVGLALPGELVEATGAGRRPPFDVVWSNAVPALRAARRGLCDPLSPGEVPNLLALGPRARPAGFEGWPVVLAYVVLYVLVFRRAAFAGRRPESWEELLDPAHRGRVAIYPDGNGIHPVAQVLGGGDPREIPRAMEPCWEVLRRLRPQVRELAYSVGMEESLRRGDLTLCFRALPNALGFRAAGVDVDWAAPREGVPDTADALWVPRGLPPQQARRAKAYVDFALSREVQRRWCDLLGVLPVRGDVPLPRELLRVPGPPLSLDGDPRILHVPDAVKAEHEDVWRERFRTIFDEGHDAATAASAAP
ncbi:MAG TPA: extracellular solute-binding protein [Solirubrobacteraceae bacterium]|nr:extracellular solute-binding protein [Solirubrobacteraceae bacterium]